MKLLDPDVEAWIRDYMRKVDEAYHQLRAAHHFVTEPVPNLDMVEHHLRLAQGKLAIARVDLAAARTAATRGKPASPPPPPERVKTSSDTSAEEIPSDAEWS